MRSSQPVGDSSTKKREALRKPPIKEKTRKTTKEGRDKVAFLALLEPNTTESD
jgi:hypothetical protein